MHDIQLLERPKVSDEQLNELFLASWPDHASREFGSVLRRSLTYFAAYAGTQVIGFVNVAWDGSLHAFLLDPTVHPTFRRRGVGTALVRAAASAATERGAEWLHVDYEPALEPFYRAAGFKPTQAGILRLTP